MIRIGVLGAKGKAGSAIPKLVKTEFSKQAQWVGGADLNEPLETVYDTDVVIDFAAPEAALNFLRLSQKRSSTPPALVVGSTGWKINERRELEELAKQTLVLQSSSFSMGTLALFAVLKKVSSLFSGLQFQPVVMDFHQQGKQEIPSSTAVALQGILAPTAPSTVAVHSVRAGDLMSEHQIRFYGKGEEVLISHAVRTPDVFARGAIEAAIWLAQKRQQKALNNGIYQIEVFLKEKFQV